MGQTADQTRAEIVRLRAEMTARVIELRRAAQRPIRVVKMAAIGAGAVVVVGGVAIVVIGVRRRAERRSLKARLKIATEAVANPEKTAKQVRATVDKTVDQSRAKLRDELREELKKELKDQRPLHERVLSTALQSAASAAVPIVLRKLEERAGFGETTGAKTRGPR